MCITRQFQNYYLYVWNPYYSALYRRISQLLYLAVISDNVLITHEIIPYLKTTKAKKRCYMAVKSDMSKAYDILEWSFIKCVLSTLDFHDTFVTLDIRVCNNSVILLLNQWFCSWKGDPIERHQVGWSFLAIHLYPVQWSSITLM